MLNAIQIGSVLIERGVRLPSSIVLETESYSSGWAPAANLDRNGLLQAVARAGWTFFFMAGEIKSTAFGFDVQEATRTAVKRLIANAAAQRCNCVDISGIRAGSFLKAPYVTVSAHARHLSASSIFRWTAHAPQV